MINLSQTTFIIPIQIDHDDRYENAKLVLGYLNHHFQTNVFIYETSVDGNSKLDFLNNFTNLNISIINDIAGECFHRTKYLNVLLNEVTTPVVVNYDIDVLLPVVSYVECQDFLIKNPNIDVIYPYGFGDYQVEIKFGFDKNLFIKNYDLSTIKSPFLTTLPSKFGHCIFFNTDSYKRGGGENENFYSWGPEDSERRMRFERMGFNIIRYHESRVFHLQHFRTAESGITNPFFNHNEKIYEYLQSLNKKELIEYYKNQEYIKQYDNFLHTI